MPLLLPAKSERRRIYIIGQGLAGSILAYLLDSEGYDVVIIDDGRFSSASKVAAGMWNPVTFIRMQESWLTHKALPFATDFYSCIEKKFGISVYHEVDLIRVFPDAHSANDWDERSVRPDLVNYLTSQQSDAFAKEFHQPFGHGVVKGAGWLNVLDTIDTFANFFSKKNKLIIQTFSAEDEQNLIHKGNIVIQCTGAKPIKDALLHWVPIIPNKGQVLTLQAPDWPTKDMINFGKFVVPVANDVLRLGATFELEPMDDLPTEQGKEELLNDLKAVKNQEYNIIQHLAGFRPTMPDRMPVMGMDSEYEFKGIFNGFGSRGVMLIPFFARHFIDHLIHGTPLMKEVNLKRFEKRYKI